MSLLLLLHHCQRSIEASRRRDNYRHVDHSYFDLRYPHTQRSGPLRFFFLFSFNYWVRKNREIRRQLLFRVGASFFLSSLSSSIDRWRREREREKKKKKKKTRGRGSIVILVGYWSVSFRLAECFPFWERSKFFVLSFDAIYWSLLVRRKLKKSTDVQSSLSSNENKENHHLIPSSVSIVSSGPAEQTPNVDQIHVDTRHISSDKLQLIYDSNESSPRNGCHSSSPQVSDPRANSCNHINHSRLSRVVQQPVISLRTTSIVSWHRAIWTERRIWVTWSVVLVIISPPRRRNHRNFIDQVMIRRVFFFVVYWHFSTLIN